jgi:hypothetical protein
MLEMKTNGKIRVIDQAPTKVPAPPTIPSRLSILCLVQAKLTRGLSLMSLILLISKTIKASNQALTNVPVHYCRITNSFCYF